MCCMWSLCDMYESTRWVCILGVVTGRENADSGRVRVLKCGLGSSAGFEMRARAGPRAKTGPHFCLFWPFLPSFYIFVKKYLKILFYLVIFTAGWNLTHDKLIFCGLRAENASPRAMRVGQNPCGPASLRARAQPVTTPSIVWTESSNMFIV